MRRVYSIPIGADFIDGLADFILRDSRPLDELAVVFPGKRPALYLRRRLAEKIGQPFYAPSFFSIETFVDHLVKGSHPDFADVEHNDAIWILHEAVASLDCFRSHPFRETGFDRFYYWGRHLFSFVDQIDAENVSDERLHSLEKNAELGYDVPGSVNKLLSNIGELREKFHSMLDEERLFTKGYKYLCAREAVLQFVPDDFRHVFFAGLFGLTNVEKEIIGHFWQRGTGDIVLEGDPGDWTVLSRLVSYLGAEIVRIPSEVSTPGSIRFYSGFDTHAEVLKAAGILERTTHRKTAVVLPLSEALFPLLTFAVDNLDTRYNISLGYPLQRTPVFDLISDIVESQAARRDHHSYPVRAYLDVMLHPFIKNLDLHEDLRLLLVSLKGLLTGEIRESTVAGRAFVTLDEMERAVRLMESDEKQRIYRGSRAGEALREMHDLLFRSFENTGTIWDYAANIERILDYILKNTPVRSYVLSGETFTRTYELLARVRGMRFSRETFRKNERENRQIVCDFLLQFLKSATLPFETRPVEPLEILGVLESRNIAFDTVVMLDVNEGVMPEPKRIDPLIPIGIYDKLGIPSPEYNEEIYRYYFYRLINSAKDVHLVYIDAEDRPRSRYIEQIIWAMEKERKALDVVEVDSTSRKIRPAPRGRLPEIPKTDEVCRALLQEAYSPSHIDDYVRCPLAFYFAKVLRFEEKREISDDIDVMDRGTIIHRILYHTFLPYKDVEIDPSMHEILLSTMGDVMEAEFRHRVVSGEFYLFKELASFKLKSFLRRNVKETPKRFVVKHLEQAFDASLVIGAQSVKLKGRMDRVDYSPDDDEYTIIDYKSGGTRAYSRKKLSGVDFASVEDIHRNIPTFQLPMYTYIFGQTNGCRPGGVDAKLIFLKVNREEVLFGSGSAGEREFSQARYMEGVKTVLSDILDPSKAFRPFDDLACPTCRFNLLCHV